MFEHWSMPSNADLLTKFQHLSLYEQAVSTGHLLEMCILAQLQQARITVEARGSGDT